MFRVFRFSAAATLAEVARTIHRTPARRIALVFPLGARSRLADLGRMHVVDALCRELYKEATIVGGDELLRAYAVASGLRAAMTVEDWRQMRAPHISWQSRRATARRSTPRLTLLPAASASTATGRDDGSSADGDFDSSDGETVLPDFVRELLILHGRDGAGADPISLRRAFADAPTVVPRPSAMQGAMQGTMPSTIAYDLDRDDALRAKWEDDEDRLTRAIRSSSGVGVAWLATP